MDYHDMYEESKKREETFQEMLNRLKGWDVFLFGDSFPTYSSPAIDAYDTRTIEYFTDIWDDGILYVTVQANGVITASLGEL